MEVRERLAGWLGVGEPEEDLALSGEEDGGPLGESDLRCLLESLESLLGRRGWEEEVGGDWLKGGKRWE